MADCKRVGSPEGSSGALAATGSMSGLQFLGAKKDDDFAKPLVLLGGCFEIPNCDVAKQVNVSELPGGDAQIRKQALTKFWC